MILRFCQLFAVVPNEDSMLKNMLKHKDCKYWVKPITESRIESIYQYYDFSTKRKGKKAIKWTSEKEALFVAEVNKIGLRGIFFNFFLVLGFINIRIILFYFFCFFRC